MGTAQLAAIYYCPSKVGAVPQEYQRNQWGLPNCFFSWRPDAWARLGFPAEAESSIAVEETQKTFGPALGYLREDPEDIWRENILPVIYCIPCFPYGNFKQCNMNNF